ncbi:helix-turn-helix domain-containing protein [Paenibacillus senegalimassiliensis]|uniref:helix-turn-helix domain-containing protein n=1 Tax=Paenibacillus senegalimassiliensis TaxID=1737426 RepID=UPI0009EB7988|nr:helix-turn-helix domain-containing protein [Paenibacillus senegalimassiliensis]
MTTADFIETLRADIAAGIKEQVLRELQPEIERRLFANNFSLDEACLYLKISEATMRRMVSKEEIPHFRIRGSLRFRQIDLDKHIEKLVQERKRRKYPYETMDNCHEL